MKRGILTLTLAAVLAAGCGEGAAVGPDETTPCGPELVCQRATEICVADQGIVVTHRCAAVPAMCDGDRSCDCAGDAVCGDVACVDGEQENEVACCPKCGQAGTPGAPGAALTAEPGASAAPGGPTPPGPPDHDSL